MIKADTFNYLKNIVQNIKDMVEQSMNIKINKRDRVLNNYFKKHMYINQTDNGNESLKGSNEIEMEKICEVDNEFLCEVKNMADTSVEFSNIILDVIDDFIFYPFDTIGPVCYFYNRW